MIIKTGKQKPIHCKRDEKDDGHIDRTMVGQTCQETYFKPFFATQSKERTKKSLRQWVTGCSLMPDFSKVLLTTGWVQFTCHDTVTLTTGYCSGCHDTVMLSTGWVQFTCHDTVMLTTGYCSDCHDTVMLTTGWVRFTCHDTVMLTTVWVQFTCHYTVMLTTGYCSGCHYTVMLNTGWVQFACHDTAMLTTGWVLFRLS